MWERALELGEVSGLVGGHTASSSVLLRLVREAEHGRLVDPELYRTALWLWRANAVSLSSAIVLIALALLAWLLLP